jgi:hypothetical protein
MPAPIRPSKILNTSKATTSSSGVQLDRLRFGDLPLLAELTFAEMLETSD